MKAMLMYKISAISKLRHILMGCFMVLLAVIFLLNTPVQAGEALKNESEAKEGSTALSKTAVHGFFSTRYRLRATALDSDQDVYQHAALDIGDPRMNKFTGHFFARGTADIDGKHDTDGHYVFDSMADTSESNLDGRVYYAYLDFHRVENMDTIRLGRQLIYESPEALYFDGARLETAEEDSPLRLKVGAYGGVPVYYLYDSGPRENYLVGAFLQSRPWPGGRIRLHYNHTDEDNDYVEETDNLYSLELWQVLEHGFQINAAYTRIDEKDRDAMLRVYYYNVEKDLILQGSYFELLSTQEIRTVYHDPFFSSTKKYYPYRQANLTFSKGAGEHLLVDGGISGRMLKDDDREGQYNHEFLRYYLGLYLSDYPSRGMEAGVTGEVWESYTLENRISSVDAELGYRLNDKFEFSVGTDYSLYKYDYYLDSERDQVRTYYAGLKYKPLENLVFDLDYQYENDDYDDYKRFEMEIRYDF